MEPRRVARRVPPETTLRVAGCEVRLLGTVAGFSPDGARVEAALAAGPVTRVALGVPPEDLPGIALLAEAVDPAALLGAHEQPLPKGAKYAVLTGGQQTASSPLHPAPADPIPDDGDPSRFAGLDAATAHFLDLLRRFGPVSAASPDLLAAHRGAERLGVPLDAIDLDDHAHTAATTKAVGLFGLRGRAKTERRILTLGFAEGSDAYDLALRFDAERNGTRGQRRVEAAREAHMADQLVALAAQTVGGRIVAILPAARFAGVVERLSAKR